MGKNGCIISSAVLIRMSWICAHMSREVFGGGGMTLHSTRDVSMGVLQ